MDAWPIKGLTVITPNRKWFTYHQSLALKMETCCQSKRKIISAKHLQGLLTDRPGWLQA